MIFRGGRATTPGASWDFVGREAELAALGEALGTLPSPAVAVVHGESGIGKTRMVAEFAQVVRTRHARVLCGTCYEGGGHPFGPWVEALEGTLVGLEAAQVEALPGADAAVLAELVPAIRGMLPDLPRAAVLGGNEGRLRLYEAVVRLLDAFDERTLVVLDDAHHADVATLDLLVHVARFAPRVAIVVTHVGVALDFDDRLARRLAEVQRHRRVEYILLSSLERDDARTLLERVAGRPLEPWLVEAVHAESGGNPFFLSELGRHLSRYGVDIQRAGDWRVPPTVLGAVALRFAPLGAETRRLLELASMFSSSFAFAELQALSELDEDILLDCLEEALGAELLRPSGDERYVFAHAIVRNALRARFSSSRRARLHRRLAETLERVHERELELVAAEIARQYHESATLPGAERGVDYALVAAERARAAHAPADAVEILKIAVALASPADLLVRGRALGELALAQAEALHLEDAPETLGEALSLLERGGVDGAQIAHLVYEVCSTLLEAFWLPLPRLIARGLAALGDTDSLAAARLQLIQRAFRPDVRPARWLNLDPDVVRTLRTLGTEADYARTIDPSDRWDANELERLVETVDSWRDPAARLRGLQALVLRTALVAPDGSPEAERICAELEALANEVASPVGRIWACISHGALLAARGEFDPALEHLARAQGLTRDWPPRSWLPDAAVLVEALTAQHVRPDWVGMATTFHKLAEDPGRYPPDRFINAAFAANAYVGAAMATEARTLLGELVPEFHEADPLDYYTGYLLDLSGSAIWELRDRELAAHLLPCAERTVAADVVDPFMTSSDLTLARLLSVLGQIAEASAAFERARVKLQRRGQGPLRAIVDHDEAVARRWHGEPGAAELKAAAHAEFERMGMAEWVGRAAVEERAGDVLPDGLTAREAEILRLLAAGMSNKQIAAELVISVHTVERHVQNAYRKVNARNRAEATAYAIRMSL